MIYQFGTDERGKVDAILAPKHVWRDSDRVVVLTGEDMPQIDAREEIERELAAKLDAGVEWDGERWHTDEEFRSLITSVIVAFDAGIIPSANTFGVRTMANTTRQLNLTQIKQLGAVVLAHVNEAYAQSWAKKDALK